MNQEVNTNNKIREFTDLIVWQEGHKLVLEIYKISKKLPENERYGLVSQIQRASVSVTSNIAEGFGRRNQKEKIQFYYISHGSLTEVKNLTFILKDVNFISLDEYKEILELLIKTQMLLLGLIKKTKESYNS